MVPTLENLVEQALTQTKALDSEYWDEGCPDAEQMWYISENLANTLTVEQATTYAVTLPTHYQAEQAIDDGRPQDTIATYLYDMIGKEYNCREW
jgi:hypothetical protein